MKIFKIIIALIIIGLVTYFIDTLASSGVVLAMGGITGGPGKSFEYGGLTLRPTKDGEPEYEESGINYERQPSPNGDDYGEGEARIGYIQQEVAMTAEEFGEFKALQDGSKRSGTFTFLNNDVLTLDCSIDGEHILTNGKLTVKLAGKVNLQ